MFFFKEQIIQVNQKAQSEHRINKQNSLKVLQTNSTYQIRPQSAISTCSSKQLKSNILSKRVIDLQKKLYQVQIPNFRNLQRFKSPSSQQTEKKTSLNKISNLFIPTENLNVIPWDKSFQQLDETRIQEKKNQIKKKQKQYFERKRISQAYETAKNSKPESTCKIQNIQKTKNLIYSYFLNKDYSSKQKKNMYNHFLQIYDPKQSEFNKVIANYLISNKSKFVQQKQMTTKEQAIYTQKNHVNQQHFKTTLSKISKKMAKFYDNSVNEEIMRQRNLRLKTPFYMKRLGSLLNQLNN